MDQTSSYNPFTAALSQSYGKYAVQFLRMVFRVFGDVGKTDQELIDKTKLLLTLALLWSAVTLVYLYLFSYSFHELLDEIRRVYRHSGFLSVFIAGSVWQATGGVAMPFVFAAFIHYVLNLPWVRKRNWGFNQCVIVEDGMEPSSQAPFEIIDGKVIFDWNKYPVIQISELVSAQWIEDLSGEKDSRNALRLVFKQQGAMLYHFYCTDEALKQSATLINEAISTA